MGVTKTWTRMIVAVALLIELAAGPVDAKSCRKRCRRAIAACSVQACTRFSGVLRAGCKRGLKITLIGACKANPAGDVCETIATENCSNGP